MEGGKWKVESERGVGEGGEGPPGKLLREVKGIDSGYWILKTLFSPRSARQINAKRRPALAVKNCDSLYLITRNQ